MSDPKAVMAKLQIIQRSINARPSGTWTKAEAPGLTDWLAFCDEVAEVYDSHTGDPFGGLAHRLSAILAYELHNLAPTRREMTPAEFEARRQQILRDLEGPPPTPPKTSGPAFGKWVFAESQRRKIPAEYIADALGITVGQLGYMTAGKVQWAAPQRKRVVEALTRYHLNGPVP